jgi:hypothetical protein
MAGSAGGSSGGGGLGGFFALAIGMAMLTIKDTTIKLINSFLSFIFFLLFSDFPN